MLSLLSVIALQSVSLVEIASWLRDDVLLLRGEGFFGVRLGRLWKIWWAQKRIFFMLWSDVFKVFDEIILGAVGVIVNGEFLVRWFKWFSAVLVRFLLVVILFSYWFYHIWIYSWIRLLLAFCINSIFWWIELLQRRLSGWVWHIRRERRLKRLESAWYAVLI